MRFIRNWYQFLEGQGLLANDAGPGNAPGTLSFNVKWLPFITPKPTTINVAGTLSPDATGTYTVAGYYAGLPYYARTTSYYLWWDPLDDFWTISTAPGSHAAGYWYAEGSPTITGTYTPSTYTGSPLVTSPVTHYYSYKGVTIAASTSRVQSAAASGFPSTAGSIEMLVRPNWTYTDGISHYFFDTYEGNNRSFCLFKQTDNLTYLTTNSYTRGSFTYEWTAGTLYHVALNWGSNELYINGVLEHTFTAAGLGTGASTLYIGDRHTNVNNAFNGTIYYFIVRDVALTASEIATFKAFFETQYIPD